MSSLTLPPPLSLSDCFDIGTNNINILRYYKYSRKRRHMNDSLSVLHSIIKKKQRTNKSHVLSSDKKRVVHRSVKRYKILVREIDGSLRQILPTDTLWYLLYIQSPPRNHRLRKIFRRRFRLNHNSFLELSNEISKHSLFARWSNKDGSGAESSDIRLLCLGALRYIGRGFTFDDIEEATAISAEVNRVFFHLFLEFGSTVLYNNHVTVPASTTPPSEWESLFKQAGFPGCIGSSGATHVGMLKCHSWATINHKGHKLNVPSRTYNTTVSHTRQILGTTFGHPSTWNDKTVILYDEVVRNVKTGHLFNDHEFTLLEYDKEGNIVAVLYSGVWFMVDNGYLSWSCTVPPLKHATTYKSIRFSEWLESIRKDVECTFGILKGRFGVLRYGIRLQSTEKCDQLYLTCCALHNRLLFVDGLHKNWKEGTESDWERMNREETVPFAVRRLNSVSSNHGNTENDENVTVDPGNNPFKDCTVGGKRVVSKMTLELFQNRLIEHFDIQFKNNAINWPSRIQTPSVY